MFELEKNQGMIPEIDNEEIYRFVINYVEDDKIAKIQKNKITGIAHGTTRLILYHNGAVRYYEINVE